MSFDAAACVECPYPEKTALFCWLPFPSSVIMGPSSTAYGRHISWVSNNGIAARKKMKNLVIFKGWLPSSPSGASIDMFLDVLQYSCEGENGRNISSVLY